MPSKLIVASTFKSGLLQQLRVLQTQAASKLMAEFFRTAMTEVPTEDGHAHEALLTAMGELSGELYGREYNKVAREFGPRRSGDPEASKAVKTSFRDDGRAIKIAVQIDLPFMKALETGLLIRVGDLSGNRGPKVLPVLRPQDRGPLYGPRSSKGTIGGLTPNGRKPLSASEAALIRKGVGLLVWEENGVIHRATFRKPTAFGFWRKAVAAVRSAARLYGLKRV